MKHVDQANALVPGDWSSLRDVIRDMSQTIDNLNASQLQRDRVKPDSGPAPQESPPGETK